MSTEIILSPGGLAGMTLSEPHKISMEEEGGLIKTAVLGYGYLSRDIERCLKKVSYTYGTSFAEKCDYLAAPHYAAVYSSAVEKLGNIHLPERAKHIREILMEVSRIKSHIFFLAKLARSLELPNIYSYCLRESEKYCDLLELYCGSRLGFGAIKVGGVTEEASDGFLYKIEKVFQETTNFIEEINEAFLENNFLTNRLSGLAVIKKEQALKYGITGPNARASGVIYDVGATKVNMGPMPGGLSLENFTGDALGRLFYRVSEIQASMKHVGSAIKKMPAGNYQMEISDEFSAPPGDVLCSVDGPRGQIYVLVVGSGTNKPASVCFGSPSINNLILSQQLLIGNSVDDLHLIIASMDICFSEVDK